MGEIEILLSPIGLRDCEFPFESDLIVCRSSSPSSYDSLIIESANSDQNIHPHMEYGQSTSPIWVVNPPSSHDFLDVEFPSYEAILEAIVGYVLYSLHLCVWAHQIRQLHLTIPTSFALCVVCVGCFLRGVPGGARYAPLVTHNIQGSTPECFFGGFC
jgi:hypothetical protein